jgi:hypothetical protein
MLGDIDPETLEIISAGRDVAEAASGGLDKTIKSEAGKEIDLDTVLHTIDQEIRRLKYFQASPPKGKVADATAALQKLDVDDRKGKLGGGLEENAKVVAEQAIDDAKWDVRLVSLPLKDGTTFLVTYGEMNTLADFYGSAAEIAQTPADNFRAIVGGVREESTRKFMRLRNELTPTKEKPYKPDDAEHDIQGAIGNKGSLRGAGGYAAVLEADQFGELKLMGEVGNEKRAEIDDKAETAYTAGLARNACHFAPHSWHAWATAHNKAVALATESWQNRDQSAKLEQQSQDLEHGPVRQGVEAAVKYNRDTQVSLDEAAADKLNSGLIENGFGDHFLQDSYAAGHLINKTQIMQWFATWLDSMSSKRDYTSPEDWRQIQQVAYAQPDLAGPDLFDPSQIGQKASNDPQAVENIGGDDWTVRFKALGLSIPSVLRTPNTDEFKLFTWWQTQAMDGNLLTADYKKLTAGPVKGKPKLHAALTKLIDDGVVYYRHYSTGDRAAGAASIGIEGFLGAKDLRIKREYIPEGSKRDAFLGAVTSAKTGDHSAYEKMAQAVTYADYHKFLNHGYLQLASNVLHDHFCAKGLEVATKENDTPYRIYGDNAMLGKESSTMVKFSAATSHQSRDAIYELAMTGNTTKTTASIASRFPTYVRPVGAKKNLSLADWHGEGGSLHKFCFDTIFPSVAGLFSKSTAIAKDKLTDKVSKDDTSAIHSGEAF